MAATMTEIAREAGVSQPLVSRFLNNDPTLRISEERRTRIERAKVKLGGVRLNRKTRNVRKKLAHKFSVPVNRNYTPDWICENIVGLELYQAFVKTLQAEKFRISINFFDPDEIPGFLKDLAPSQGYCDGFFLEGSGIIDQEIAQWLLKNKIPHVSTDPRVERLGVNTVFNHKINGLSQAVEHLLELGHRRIGYVGISKIYRREFLSAILEKEVHFKNEDFCQIPNLSLQETPVRYRDHAREEFSKWFQSGREPTAVICSNDHIAMGVIDVLKDRGLKAGKDLSVVGYDNIEQRGSNPSEQPFLTTVDVPNDIVGRRCAERLLEQVLYGHRSIVHEYIPVKLIVRETTGTCPVGK